MADYTGSRRAAPAPAAPDLSSAAAAADVVGGAAAGPATSCPQCGALVRPEQGWCTLCLHVFREPEPERELTAVPELASVPVPGLVRPAAAEPGVAPSTALTPEVEAAAEALLEQLALQTRNEGLRLPSFLQSKSQKALAVAVAMTVLSGAVLLVMTVLGALLH